MAVPSELSIAMNVATPEQVEAKDGMIDPRDSRRLDDRFPTQMAVGLSGENPGGERSDQIYSLDHTTLLEPLIADLQNEHTLPEVPWDAFLNESTSEHETSSISS
jgi:hypothetical protein